MLIGILFLILSYGLTAAFPSKLRHIYALILSSRLVIVFLNLTIGLPGGRGDAIYFFNQALNVKYLYPIQSDAINEHLCQISVQGNSFVKCLFAGNLSFKVIHALIQSFTPAGSFFASHCLSILISGIAIYYLYKTFDLFQISSLKAKKILIIVYGLIPSIATFQSYVLRECFQSLVIIFITYFIVKFYLLREHSIFEKCLCVFLSIFSLTLHPIFFLITPSLFIVPFLCVNNIFDFPNFKKNLNIYLSISWVLVLLIVLGAMFFIFAKDYFYMLRFLLTYGPFDFISKFLSGSISEAIDAKAQYGIFFDSNNIFSSFYALVIYLVAPIGFSSRLMDLVLYPEKIFVLFSVFKYVYKRNSFISREKIIMDSMILNWLIISILFSLGTTNWGTAARHQVISFSLVLIPFIYSSINIPIINKTTK